TYARFPVQRAQRVHHVIERDRPERAVTQRRSGLDRAGVRCPRGEDRALLRKREGWMGNHLIGMREGLRGMEQRFQLERVRLGLAGRKMSDDRRVYRLLCHGVLLQRRWPARAGPPRERSSVMPPWCARS